MTGRKEIVITHYEGRPILMYQMDDKPYDLIVGEEPESEALEVGDIFVGRVQNIVPNINAAFIEVQKDVICYLPKTECAGKKLRIGDEIVVQVKKAAVKTKQAVATTSIELVGTYSVVSMGNSTRGISKRIVQSEVRESLQALLTTYSEKEYGIMLRTNAAEVSIDVVKEECDRLCKELEDIVLYSQHKKGCTKLRAADSFYMAYIRNCRPEEYDRIVTDDETIFADLSERGVKGLEFYEDETYPLEKRMSVSTKLEKALSKRVWLKSGGNLVIEPTEALTVIDVNTGKAIDGKRNKETTFFKINCEAATEVARQMRLRSMSGIILVDFIDMQKRENQKELMALLQEELDKDKTRTALVDITKLGLVEITRMKSRPPLWELW